MLKAKKPMTEQFVIETVVRSCLKKICDKLLIDT